MEITQVKQWIDPPDSPLASDVLEIDDPAGRARAAHKALQDLGNLRAWLVRARGEAIAMAYARGVPYAALGAEWGVSGERVRQMMFQLDEKRTGWHLAQDVRARRTTPRPFPYGIVHAMRAYDDHAACGLKPVNSLGADFTGTIYPACNECIAVVSEDLAARQSPPAPATSN
jgi:hypothetical protein